MPVKSTEDPLNERVRRLAQGDNGDRQARERLAEAARASERGRFGQQMREIAEAVRRGDAKAIEGDPQRSVARELDRPDLFRSGVEHDGR